MIGLQILIILLIFEAILRIAGFVKDKLMLPGPEAEDEFVILCVGDSTTEGLGVSADLSYPSRLQQLLEKKSDPGKFRVINIGKAGINSSQVLNRLPGNINRYHPDLILLLIGINDSWNFNQSNIWMFEGSGVLNRLKLRLDLLLAQVKIYQFVRLLILSQDLKLVDLNDERRLLAKSFERHPEKSFQLEELLFYNIGEIVAIAQNYKSAVFLMTYQKEGIGNIRRIINRAYSKFDLPIVDNQALFEQANLRGIKAISEDNYHPNALGYSMIAENIYNKMIEENIIQVKPLDYFQ